MKNFGYLIVLLTLVTFSCSDDSDPIQACNVDNVLDLPWLQEKIEMYQVGDHTITMGTYDSQTVFVATTCCALCNMTAPPVFDCSGNLIGKIGYDGIMLEEIADKEIVWKSEDKSCGM
ncbi:hypothetical protein GCM10009119_43060 [Algoriphagus jejuensis]|uniref:Uncharacterized protein n=1 Tax=Algoriphagus jejuensis TaxID=419934 RepID=A0ABN1N5U0_9BACT